jgi:hypothetical protein
VAVASQPISESSPPVAMETTEPGPPPENVAPASPESQSDQPQGEKSSPIDLLAKLLRGENARGDDY